MTPLSLDHTFGNVKHSSLFMINLNPFTCDMQRTFTFSACRSHTKRTSGSTALVSYFCFVLTQHGHGQSSARADATKKISYRKKVIMKRRTRHSETLLFVRVVAQYSSAVHPSLAIKHEKSRFPKDDKREIFVRREKGNMKVYGRSTDVCNPSYIR